MKIMGIGDWGLGIGDWGLGIGPNPQSPIHNSQSQIPNPHETINCFNNIIFNYKIINLSKLILLIVSFHVL